MNFKKCSFRLFLLIVPFLFLTGCGGMSPLTVTEEMLDSGGNVVSKTTSTVADASVAKERIVHKTLQVDTEGYYAALGLSGSKMEVTGYQEMVLADGSKGYLPLISSSFREAPKRNTALPTAPSIHPIWHFGESVVKASLTYGIADILAGVTEKAFDSAQTKYYGDYNPQTAEPYIVEPLVVISE